MQRPESSKHSLLIAFDGSPGAGTATQVAGSLFRFWRAAVLNVRREPLTFERSAAAARIAVPDEVISGGLASLERAAAAEAEAIALEGARIATAAGLAAEPRTTSTSGSPWRGIRDEARTLGADAIVLGSRGLGTVSRAVLGSTASTLLHNAGRPTVVVPQDALPRTGPVAIGYDGSQQSRDAIETTSRLLTGRAVIVVTVWQSAVRHSFAGRALAAAPLEEIRGVTRDVDEYYEGVAAALAEEGAALAREHGLDAEALAVDEERAAWRGLSATAASRAAALIVVGSRGHGAIASAVLGSVSAGLVNNADVPVMVVPDA